MPNHHRQSGYATVVVLFFIVIVAVLTLFIGRQLLNFLYPPLVVDVSPTTPQPTHSLYYDKEMGFEFKFPTGYNIIDDDEEKFSSHAKATFRKNFTGYVGYEPPQLARGLIVQAKDNGHPDQFEAVPLTLWIFNNPKLLTIDQWYERYWYYPFIWGQFAQPQKGKSAPINISSVSGQLSKSNIISYRPSSPKFVYLARGPKMYLFKIMDESSKNTGDEILASFTFK